MSAKLWSRCLLLVSLAGLFSCGPTTPAAKKMGEPCAPTLAPGEIAAECADGLCVALDTASGFCTGTCETDDNCPDQFICQAAGAYGRICRKLTGCKSDPDCPAGHTCNPDTGNCFINVSRTLCSPCQDDKQCPAGGACFKAVGTGEQFCTTACDAGACPAGYECQQIPAGPDKQLIAQCVPSSLTCSFGKPICARCLGDNECGSALDLCVRNVVSNETFCGRDCDPRKNVCPSPGCDPLALGSAQNPDCPTGFSCTNLGGQSDDPNASGPFQCVPNSNSCEGYCDATDELGQVRQCGLGKTCNGGACSPALDGRQCAPCLDNDDCRTGPHTENRCVVNDCPDCPFKGETFCASPCADTAACVKNFGAGFVCETVSDTTGANTKYCLPQRGTCASGVGRLGDDCAANGAQDCLAGVCLQVGASAICSLPCTKDGDCADNRYRCCETSGTGYDCSADKRDAEGPKSGSGICAPNGGLFGDDCTPGRPPCQSGTCLDLGTARLCTVPCAAGCPSGFSCRKAKALGSSEDVDVCFPDGGGKAGADCAFGPAACESGLCIRKDSGPVCTVPCADVSECPEGWRCEATATVTLTSVQACLPPSLQ